MRGDRNANRISRTAYRDCGISCTLGRPERSRSTRRCAALSPWISTGSRFGAWLSTGRTLARPPRGCSTAGMLHRINSGLPSSADTHSAVGKSRTDRCLHPSWKHQLERVSRQLCPHQMLKRVVGHGRNALERSADQSIDTTAPETASDRRPIFRPAEVASGHSSGTSALSSSSSASASADCHACRTACQRAARTAGCVFFAWPAAAPASLAPARTWLGSTMPACCPG